MICICKHCLKQYYKSANMYTATCEQCKSVDNMIYEQIKAYLKNYPNSNAIQISEALNIKAVLVVKYIDEGRLFMTNGRFSQLPDD